MGTARPGVLQAPACLADGPDRVTTSAEMFDDHFESHEFLSPGGALFEALAEPSIDGRRGARRRLRPLLAGGSGPERQPREMIVLTPHGVTRVH